MNKMVLFLASLLLYSLSSAAQSRETKVIDFRYQQISQSEPQTVGGSIQTLPGHEGPRVTETLVLKISDLMITQGSESAADYKLQIMNNGSQPVAVPITQELASLYAPEELTQVDFDCLSFSFTWDSAKEGARNLPAAIVLYGRKDRPWSFLNLQPGYWVTIRGRVNLPSQPTKQEGNLQANALFAVMKYRPTPKGLVLDWTIIKDLQSDKVALPATR